MSGRKLPQNSALRHDRDRNEPPHDKTTKWSLRRAKTQISLGIRPVWSKSSLSAWRNLVSWANHWAHGEDSYQTGRMPGLIWEFAGRTNHFVGFVMRRLKFVSLSETILAASWQNQQSVSYLYIIKRNEPTHMKIMLISQSSASHSFANALIVRINNIGEKKWAAS